MVQRGARRLGDVYDQSDRPYRETANVGRQSGVTSVGVGRVRSVRPRGRPPSSSTDRDRLPPRRHRRHRGRQEYVSGLHPWTGQTWSCGRPSPPSPPPRATIVVETGVEENPRSCRWRHSCLSPVGERECRAEGTPSETCRDGGNGRGTPARNRGNGPYLGPQWGTYVRTYLLGTVGVLF